MAKLIITRKSEFFNWARDYRICLNGEEIGKIASGKTKEFDIPEGTNTLKAKIDWCGSQDFRISVNKDETRNILIKGFPRGSLMMILMTCICFFPLLVSEFIKDHLYLKFSLITFSVAVLLYLGYYLTVGRNRYLEISENLE